MEYISISVIVCTYNRCQTLQTALKSIGASNVPSSVEWEILVVDNNSSDATRQAVEDLQGHYPGRIRYLLEPKQGLSHARNAGVREARGEILAFTDDDVVVEQDWLRNLVSELWDGTWAGAGGRILPVWDRPLPNWLSLEDPDAMGPFVAFDLGSEPAPLTQAPYGANMAFRKQAFEKYGMFRTDLGRCGGKLLSGEDSDFGDRLLAQGERLRYEPNAVVHHPAPENRLRKDYTLSYWFWKGQSDVALKGNPSESSWSVAGIPLYLLRRIARWAVQWQFSVNPKKRFACRRAVWHLAGKIVASYRYSRSGRGQRMTASQFTDAVGEHASSIPRLEPVAPPHTLRELGDASRGREGIIGEEQ